MRRFVTFLLCISLFASVSFAADVNTGKAMDYARKAMNDLCPNINTDALSLIPIKEDNVVCLYAVNFQPEGWLLLSADDAMPPVIGYSSTGSFVLDNMPINVDSWMNIQKCFVKELKSRAKKIGGSVRHDDWDKYDSEEYLTDKLLTRASSSVAPLIQVNWNQTGNYNKYCPSNKDGRAVVGCVAVAMGQAMSVFRYPERPNGLATYSHPTYGTIYVNYDNESAYKWNDILTGANNKDEVARLLYHCGVSLNMDYSPSGSGAQSKMIAFALKEYFSYPQSVKYYNRDSFSDADWDAMLMEEMSNGRAVCYGGYDSKHGYGHCFNLDGTDGNGFYHVNWGWGGQNNGYFSINGLRDATMNMDYTDYQGVVVGIRPPSDKPSNMFLSNNTVLEYKPAGTVVGSIEVESEAKDPVYTYTIQGPYSPITHRYVTAPFIVENNQLVTTKELKCSDKTTWDITITVTNTKNKASYSKLFSIHVSSVDAIESVSVDAKTVSNGVYDLQGRKIADSLEALKGKVSGVVIVRTSNGSRKVVL